jgi:hypothetical protein
LPQGYPALGDNERKPKRSKIKIIKNDRECRYE